MSELLNGVLSGLGANIISNFFWYLKSKRESSPENIESRFTFEFYESVIEKLCKKYQYLTLSHMEVFLSKEGVQLGISNYMQDLDSNKLFNALKKEFLDEIEGNYFSERDVENILLSFFEILEDELRNDSQMRELVSYQRISGISNMVVELHDHFKPEFSKNMHKIATLISLEEVPTIERFTGRENEIEELLNNDANIFVLEGISGVGKTYLAAQLALISKSKKDTFWYTLNETSTINSILNKLLVFLELPNQIPNFEKSLQNNDYLSEKITFIIEKLEEKHCVLFFDDYHRIKDDRITILFESFKKKLFNSKIYVTIQPEPLCCFYDQSDLIHKRCILKKVNGLKYDDVKLIFNQLNVELEEKFLAKIYEQTEGHPVAAELFAVAIKNGYVAEELLKESPLTPDNLMDYLFEKVFFKLSTDEQEFLKSLSVFRTPVTIEALNFVYVKRNSVEISFRLLQKRLIDKNGHTYKIHPVIKNPSYSLISEKKEFHERSAEFYSTRESIFLEDVLELMYHLINSGKYLDSASLAIEFNYLFLQQGYSHPFLELLLSLKDKNFDLKTKIYIGTIIGSIYASQKKNKEAEAIFQEFILMSREINYINGEASLLNNLSSIQMDNRETKKALKNQLQSLDLYSKHNDPKGKAHVILNIAMSYFECNNLEKAEKCALESLALISAHSKNEQQMNYTDLFLQYRVIGGVYNLLGKINEQRYFYDDARNYYNQCQRYALISGNYSLASINSGDLGNLYAKMGYYEESENEYFEELKYAKITGEVKHIQSAYDHIGNALSLKGEYSKACDYYKKSLEISLRFMMFKNTSLTYYHIALDFLTQNESNKTKKYCAKAVEYAKKSKSLDCISNSYIILARLNYELGNEKAVLHLLKKVLSYPDDQIMLHQKAIAYTLLGDISIKNENYSEAEINYTNSLNTFEMVRYWEGLAIACQKVIPIYLKNKKVDKILQCQKKMESKLHYLSNQQEITLFYECLIDSYLQLNQSSKLKSVFLSKISYEINLGLKSEASKSCTRYSVYLRDNRMYDSSLHIAKIGVRLSLEAKDNYSLCISYLTLGNTFLSIGKQTEALALYSKSVILRSSMKLEEETIRAYINLASIYGIIGNDVLKEDIEKKVLLLCTKHNIPLKDMDISMVYNMNHIIENLFQK